MRLLGHEVHTLTGAYAVDAIAGRERERFEHHLQRCQPCEREVRGLQETATRLATAVALAPPEHLKEQVLAAVARTRQLSPAADSRHLPRPMPAAGLLRRVALPMAAACLIVAVVLGVLLGISRSQLGVATARQRAIAAVLAAPDARLIREPVSVGGMATVVASASQHRFVFASSGLPVLASGRVYELWVMGPGNRAVRVGLLARLADGKTVPVLAGGLGLGDRVGVTVEPAGGTSRPTTSPIVVLSPA